jgi:hypothetical protein
MGHLIKCEVGLVIADVEKNPSHILKEARIANAHLIAASPKMLAALERLSEVFDLPEHDEDRAHAESCAMRFARDAIAKAKGSAA